MEPCISITITIGDLDDALLDLEQYGTYLRGFNKETGVIEDEPNDHLETVLSIQVTAGVDLDARWKLTSDRASEAGAERDLSYSARQCLAPTRLGPVATQHLSWGPRSILNRFSTASIAEAGAALAAAARQARASFGAEAKASLETTLATVAAVSEQIGVDLGEGPLALLDAHGVSFTGGTIALHNADGVPLRNLGLGSARLLVAALQLEAGQTGTIAIIDEIEHGLEPHRIMRLLHTLGAKRLASEAQVFITTHSPVVVRELSAGQIAVVRRSFARSGSHTVKSLQGREAEQKVLRACAEAFLARAVIVCEGETEVGLLRGLDLHRQQETLNVGIDRCT
jgi:putative ATP-dependent endonuclease of OLD family